MAIPSYERRNFPLSRIPLLFDGTRPPLAPVNKQPIPQPPTP